jgi:nitrogen fixation protein NifU and related proteins
MSELRELYQEVIIDHGRRPRNFGVLQEANHIQEGFNPLCGDRLKVYLTEQDGVIAQLTFEGSGCAISMASASLMTEFLKGKTLQEAREIFTRFHAMVTQCDCVKNLEAMGKLAVLSGVVEFPARVKCATLAWHTLVAAMNQDQETVSTE